ncbi:MAG: 2-amino-4-hydroxy-6-hydroxymethyldihydropteridine diphosphokinase, partial [Promicromonosporaceae bacterium]|nr:2-amino-4-hydroxy-6-hydroxymethyldihydropteridine diphosphokinase [Promicromonosporaceae bacterium]
TLDIDLICYDSLVASAPDLTLPHPRAAERAFVLVPWAQMDPTAELPGLGGGPIAALAATAPDADGIRWLALDWCEAPPGIQL